MKKYENSNPDEKNLIYFIELYVRHDKSSVECIHFEKDKEKKNEKENEPVGAKEFGIRMSRS